MNAIAALKGNWNYPTAIRFGVGRIGRDQVTDYAARKGWTVAEAERWRACAEINQQLLPAHRSIVRKVATAL